MNFPTRNPALAAACTAALLAITGCSVSIGGSQRPNTESEIETIREARLAQNRAIREQDLDAIAEVLEPDVHVTSGIGIHIVGRDAYRRAYEDDFEVLEDVIYTRTPDEIEISAVDTGMAERIAAESGTWTGSFVTPRGPAQMRGVYSAMWRKRSGRWRINSEIFVSLVCSGAGCP
ncbi:MAG TPA: nuclear transport factor 2 family protein [Gemmatimonadota bacterium]|nr:nuclear transport factor 2 family protein [Gemmatimonadota bacterium]